MSNKSKFKITRFENPSGERVFRVIGTIEGKQIRRNFKNRADAVQLRDELEVKRRNGSSSGQFLWVKMTHEQNDDAWTALQLLKKSGAAQSSLMEAAQYYLRHYRAPKSNVPLKEATRKYLFARERELCNETLSAAQFKSIRSRMRRLASVFGERTVADIQTQDLEEDLSSRNLSLKTWNNERGYLHKFFEYCIEQRYAAANPASKLTQHKLRKSRGTAQTLTAKQAADLMEFVEKYEGHTFANGESAVVKGCFVPFFALALFAGIRPDWENGEISKISRKDINLRTNTIHIEPEASKNNEKRNIRIQPNLKQWLRSYPIKDYPILPVSNMDRSLREIRKAHNLTHDILQHTFISMHVGKFRSIGDAALEAGNSESIVRKHYLDVISKPEATKFWKILPIG